jgi:hypothetical protein
MVIRTVDDRYANVLASEFFRHLQPAEASADNHYVRLISGCIPHVQECSTKRAEESSKFQAPNPREVSTYNIQRRALLF